MDRLERAPQPVDVMQAVLLAHQSAMWTAMPGIIKAYRQAKHEVDVQIAIQVQVRQPDQQGTVQWIKIAMLPDVPVFFPSGGGFTLTFPIKVGDECLVVIASRCIDAWRQSGGEDNQQSELRMHDLSDGFAFVGFRSLPEVLSPAPSTTDVALRSDDGQTKISIKADLSVLVQAPASIVLTAPQVTINGDLQVNGEIDATGIIHSDNDVIADDVSGHDHVHVKGGGVSTDPPTPM